MITLYFYQCHGSQLKVILGVNTRMYVDVDLDNLKKLFLQVVPEIIRGGNSVIIFNKVNVLRLK